MIFIYKCVSDRIRHGGKHLHWLCTGETCKGLVEREEELFMGHTNKKIMEIYRRRGGWIRFVQRRCLLLLFPTSFHSISPLEKKRNHHTFLHPDLYGSDFHQISILIQDSSSSVASYADVLVSARVELIFFPEHDTVLCFGFSMRMMLTTQRFFSCC